MYSLNRSDVFILETFGEASRPISLGPRPLPTAARSDN